MAIEKKSFKKMFPKLYDELEEGENKVSIDAVRKTPEEEAEELQDALEFEQSIPDKFRHFSPSAVDFIRRCDTHEQAEEIIAYLEKKGELSCEDAKKMRCQLKNEGLRSFGCKKEDNYYFKEAGLS
ncbi:MAG: DUF2095 domain-containing protein [Candidatus Bathyarchaeota archaeon]|nr:DUF2095 domain-containing protein [Candidatus Bathyarchaeota archaeon]